MTGFSFAFCFQIVGLLLICLTVYWVEHHKGGVVWGSTPLGIAFNWHPVLMTLSLILLYGNGQWSAKHQLLD